MSVDDSSSITSLVALSGKWTAVIDGAKLETEMERYFQFLTASVSLSSRVRWSDTFIDETTGQTVVAAAKAVRDAEHNMIGVVGAGPHNMDYLPTRWP